MALKTSLKGARRAFSSPAGFRLTSTATRGRSLAATRAFAPGERVFMERPIIVADPLAPRPQLDELGDDAQLTARLMARLPLGPLREACARDGLRYPLLVAEMVARSLVGKAAGADAPSFERFWGAVASLTAPLPPEQPERWAEQYALLRDAYCDEAAGIAGAYQLFVPGALDEAWYAGTLCVLHANLVKVSAREVALFAIGSMCNHDCAHNLDFDFAPDAEGGVAHFTARAPIAAGDELTITYVSPLRYAEDGGGGGGGGAPRGVPDADGMAALRTAHGFDCASCACATKPAP